MNMSRWIVLGVAGLVVAVVLIGRSPSPIAEGVASVDPGAGFTRFESIGDGSPIDAQVGMLRSLVPKVAFQCAGIVLDTQPDRQDGFHRSLTIGYGRLADAAVFEHLQGTGAMGREFEGGFVLDTAYFRSHVTAFYVRPASPNLKKVTAWLEAGDQVCLKGSLVYLDTDRGLLTTSLDQHEFRCKYAYVEEITVNGSVYR
jgi:hypothetical protein